MLKLIKHITPFLIVQFIFILIISVILLNFNKNEAHIWVNQYHHTVLDYMFYILTQSVEFWSCLIIFTIVGFVKNYKLGLIGFITYAITGLIAQLLKRNVFSGFNRPTYNINDLRLIPDYFNFEQHSNFSFPSGHSTAAFTVFIFLALISTSKKWMILFAILACLVAFSRVYLSQHYFIDIIAGSILGSGLTIILYFLLKKLFFKPRKTNL